jgi:ubiquinone/menaquinone biosynthesis C-methylase UbiE
MSLRTCRTSTSPGTAEDYRIGIYTDNWKTFFFNENEGEGTLYDRLILHTFFDRFIENKNIKTVLDCPSFGMTGFSGINSMYLAKKGVKVTVADDNSERLLWTKHLWENIGMAEAATFVHVEDWSSLPFKDGSFDLVWNLSSLWHINEKDVPSLVAELGRVYKQVLFMSVYNAKQLVYPLYKKFDSDFFDKVNEKFCKEQYLADLFRRKLSAHTFEKGYFVTTPWPGLIVKKEELFGGSKRQENTDKSEVAGAKEDMKTPTYISILNNPEAKTMQNMMFLERLPNFLKKYWAHLTYFIFEKSAG